MENKTTALRDLLAVKKGHTLLNLLGLTLGMAFLLLLLLYIRSELSYDRHHKNADRIYRVTETVYLPGDPIRYAALTPLLMGPTLKQDFPQQIADTVRLMPVLEGIIPGKVAVRKGQEKQFYEWFAWIDESFFNVFTLPLVAGNPDTALEAPNKVILSESAARRYFGGEPAVGKTLKIDSGFSDAVYEVTGVFEDFPDTSHFHFDILASWASLDLVTDTRVVRDQWWVSDAYTYILLRDGVSPQQVDEKFPAFVQKYFGELSGAKAALRLQALNDIHLRSQLLGELEPNGNIRNVHNLAMAALVTFLIVCFNFMILTAARHAGRAGEPGNWSFRRFFAESLLLALVGIALAVLLIALALPAFNELTDKQVSLPLSFPALLILAGLVLLPALAAALYSTAVVPRLRRRGAGILTKALVALELAVAVAVLAGAGVVRSQLRFMSEQDLGFDMENIVVVPIRDVGVRDNFLTLKAAVERHPNVIGTTFSSLVIGRATPQIGSWLQDVKDLTVAGSLIMDPDFLKVFDIELIAGRPLQPTREDVESGFLVNEAALPQWGVSSPQEVIGKGMVWNGTKRGKVAGVIRNFNHQPLQYTVEPLILHIRPLVFRYLYVKVKPEGLDGTIDHLEKTWHGMAPDKPFESFILEEEYNRAYRGEERLGRLMSIAVPLALFFAALGLLGLASFRVERLRSETPAASVGAYAKPLLVETAVLVVIGCLLAGPLVYQWMQKWLEHFGYRTDINIAGILVSGVIVLLVAWLTVSYRAWRAASTKPAIP